jgi:hypothetical protein
MKNLLSPDSTGIELPRPFTVPSAITPARMGSATVPCMR